MRIVAERVTVHCQRIEDRTIETERVREKVREIEDCRCTVYNEHFFLQLCNVMCVITQYCTRRPAASMLEFYSQWVCTRSKQLNSLRKM